MSDSLSLPATAAPRSTVPTSDVRPRRVLMLLTSLVQGGGAESQVVRLSTELQLRGYEVSVVSLVEPSAHVDELKNAGVQVHSLEMVPGLPDVRAVFRLRRILEHFRPDVVHCHMFHANLLGRITRLFSRVPVLICTAHSIRENSRKGGSSWHREMLYRVTDGLADRTTIICNRAYERYVRVGAASRKKLMVIPNGVNTSIFTPAPHRKYGARRELGLNETFVWLAVGRLVVQKDYPNLFKALKLLTAEHFTLLIAGEGPLEESLRKECVAHGLNDCVRFCGARKNMLDLYEAADGFVMSSEVEGLPMAALEAAAVGLPSVVTNVGGIPDVVLNGVSGYVVPPHDPTQLASALQSLMHASPKRREIMGRAARQYCREHYAMETIVQRWTDLYSECLSSARVRGRIHKFS